MPSIRLTAAEEVVLELAREALERGDRPQSGVVRILIGIIERGTLPPVMLQPNQLQHEDSCDLMMPDRNSADRCNCRTGAALQRQNEEASRAADQAELDERKENAGWHLKSCQLFQDGYVGNQCTCDARGWLERRARRQGEARAAVADQIHSKYGLTPKNSFPEPSEYFKNRAGG